MRFTLLTSAIAMMTFAVTFAFAPAIADASERLGFGKSEATRLSEPRPVPVSESRECRSSLQMIVIALSHKDCK